MRKNIIILSGVLVFCALLLGVIKLVQQIKKPIRPIIKIESEKISEFSITSNKGTCKFKKEFNVWRVNDFKADKKLIDQLFDKIKNIQLTDIISESKDRWDEFEVTESSGVKLELPGVSFFIGKIGYSWDCFYFRFADKDEVWLSKGLSRGFVERPFEEWIDSTILSLNKDEVSEIEISEFKNKKLFEKTLFVKTSDYWIKQGAKEEKFEEEKISEMLDILCSLYADEIPERKRELENIDFVINVKTKSGTNYEINIEKERKDEFKYLAKSNITDMPFIIYDYKIRKIIPQKQKQ